MHVASITSRRTGKDGVLREYVSHLLRRTFREDGQVKHETLANLFGLPRRFRTADLMDFLYAAVAGWV